MGLTSNKVFLSLSSKASVLSHTIRSVVDSGVCAGVVLVVREADRKDADALLEAYRRELPHIQFISTIGGNTRQESVFRGLLAVQSHGIRWVLVHDGARPFCSPKLIRTVTAKAVEHGAAILALPSRQSLKLSPNGDEIECSVDRSQVWEAQTPQVFVFDELLAAHHAAVRDGVVATDDSELVERQGIKVRLVPGDDKNLKITAPFDLVVAKAILEELIAETGATRAASDKSRRDESSREDTQRARSLETQ